MGGGGVNSRRQRRGELWTASEQLHLLSRLMCVSSSFGRATVTPDWQGCHNLQDADGMGIAPTGARRQKPAAKGVKRLPPAQSGQTPSTRSADQYVPRLSIPDRTTLSLPAASKVAAMSVPPRKRFKHAAHAAAEPSASAASTSTQVAAAKAQRPGSASEQSGADVQAAAEQSTAEVPTAPVESTPTSATVVPVLPPLQRKPSR